MGAKWRAVRGVVSSVLGMIRGGATHIGVATDHVIESFRNGLWPGYKTSAGVDRELLSQFPLLEEALTALVSSLADGRVRGGRCAGVGGAAAARDPRVERVIICTPDKDLAQSVAARGWSSSIGAPETRRRSRRDAEVRRDRRRRFLIISRSSATPRTAIPDFPAGARNHRPRCSRGSATSNPSRRTGALARERRQRRAAGRRRFSRIGSLRCCFGPRHAPLGRRPVRERRRSAVEGADAGLCGARRPVRCCRRLRRAEASPGRRH